MRAMRLRPLSSCAQCGVVYCPRPMRNRRAICATFCLCAGFVLVCACEKHHVGEMPEVQREHAELGSGEAPRAERGGETSTSASPSSTATPAEFFRGSKPR